MTEPVIQVRIIDFPARGNETVTKNEDDSYTIFINAKLSCEMRMKAYKHAIKHIINGDFEKEYADEIEYKAHYG